MAIAALCGTAACAVPLLLGHAVFLALGIVFPFAFTGSFNSSTLLPQCLAKCYVAVMLVALALCPFVLRSQLTWVDLADLHGFPDDFYGPFVIAEIRKRHLRDSFLRARVGHRLSQYTLSFLEDQA
eukprot:TRINITY_DN47150_c0_g1_i1.p1 TRINITY_DN47150_c0_g1~~TRINITY_DN47150_c0_g1_i1.p1  ORF type:complete len:140 (+),score=16.09 TRINITY_DN47150_c0_g1_i1:44-421(+)